MEIQGLEATVAGVSTPSASGNWKNIHTRFSRWAKSGVWESFFKTLADDPDNEYAMIDATIVETCISIMCGRTQKGGFDQAIGPLARRPDHQDPCDRRRSVRATRWRSASPAAKSTTSPRPRPSRPKCSPKPSSATKALTRSGLFRSLEGPRHQAGHPAKIKSQAHARLRLSPLRRTQPHRAFLSIHQTVPRHRDPLRKNRAQFPRRPAFGLRLGLAQMRTRSSMVSKKASATTLAGWGRV